MVRHGSARPAVRHMNKYIRRSSQYTRRSRGYVRAKHVLHATSQVFDVVAFAKVQEAIVSEEQRLASLLPERPPTPSLVLKTNQLLKTQRTKNIL